MARGEGVQEALHAGAAAAGGTPAPKLIGIDEISIKKRRVYRILVSDLVRERPIRFGGLDRSEASMDESFDTVRKSRGSTVLFLTGALAVGFVPSPRIFRGALALRSRTGALPEED